MPEQHASRWALLLLSLAVSLSPVAEAGASQDPATRLVFEAGAVNGNLRGPTDADCEQPDEGPQRFLDCLRPAGHSGETVAAGAAGFEQRFAPGWWTGFRVGALGSMETTARVRPGGGETEAVRFSLKTQYVLAGIRHDFRIVESGWIPYLGAGLGLARTGTRGLERERENETWRAPDQDRTGYLLRLETGLAWRWSNGMELHLGLRHDQLDSFETPADSGEVIAADGESSDREFAATTGRGGLQSAVVGLAVPIATP